MIRVCSTCGIENGPTAVHCRNCRAKLQEPNRTLAHPQMPSRWRSFLRAVFRGLVLLAVGAAAFWLKENVNWRGARSDAASFSANGQLVWSNALSAVARWYAKWLSAEPAPPPAPPSASPRSPAPTPAPTSAPPVNEIKIRCQRCGGLGYTILRQQKTVVDLTANKHTVTETSRAACQLCAQKGGRTIVLPPGAEICPACYGLGLVINKLDRQESVQHCQICFGKGYVVRKY